MKKITQISTPPTVKQTTIQTGNHTDYYTNRQSYIHCLTYKQREGKYYTQNYNSNSVSKPAPFFWTTLYLQTLANWLSHRRADRQADRQTKYEIWTLTHRKRRLSCNSLRAGKNPSRVGFEHARQNTWLYGSGLPLTGRDALPTRLSSRIPLELYFPALMSDVS